MNILLWIVQVVLAFMCVSGGAYKIFAYAELLTMEATASVPRGLWIVLGTFEIVCGVLLIVPMAFKWMPKLTPLAAAVLAVECLGLALHYARFSLELTAANPLTWVLAMAAMAVFVAWGRYPSLRTDSR